MPKRKEPAKDQQFTCSNSACGWVFSKPVKVINLRQTKSEPYDACPRCLTEIVIGSAPSVDSKQGIGMETEPLETKAKMAERQPTSPCAYHFGYLSEKSRNEKIPDDCVMCENIVKCMLKTVNG